MNKDGVNAAFEIILEEISSVEAELADEGSAAFKAKRYSEADKLSASGKRLEDFRRQLEQLQGEWKQTVSRAVRERVRIETPAATRTHTKAQKSLLRVVLPSGHVVQHTKAADTFADVLEYFGLDVVRELGMVVNGIPLVGTQKNTRYAQTRRGHYLIVTHSSTLAKKAMLEKIGRQLKKPLRVERV